MTRRLFVVLSVLLVTGVVSTSLAFTRKRLSIEQMVQSCDMIVRGEIVQVSPHAKEVARAALRVDEVVYGADDTDQLTLVSSLRRAQSSRDHILGVTFKVGDKGTFFLRRLPRGLDREFAALSGLWWNPEITTIPSCGVDAKLDYFFVPFAEMFHRQDEKQTEHNADAKLLRLVQERLKADVKRYSQAHQSAQDLLAKTEKTATRDKER